LPTMLFGDDSTGFPDVLRLHSEETGSANQRLEFLLVRFGKILRSSIFLEQLWRHDVHHLVRTLRGQDRCHKQLERVREVKRAFRVRIRCLQTAEDALCAQKYAFPSFHGLTTFLSFRTAPAELWVRVSLVCRLQIYRTKTFRRHHLLLLWQPQHPYSRP